VADREGFLVVYPAGAEEAGPRIWHLDSGAGLLEDVKFIGELIDTLEAAYRIDPRWIYVNGVSAGGGMAFVLSCKLADRIAAVGVVAGAQLFPWRTCRDQPPVPMIAFHGTADRLTPYDGGRTWVARDVFPRIPAWTAQWARRNGCGPIPVQSAVAADVTLLDYPDCAGGSDVELYRVEGGGHSWPGGKPLPAWLAGRTSSGVDATGLMWAFFRAHPLRAGAGQ
jgi:polyhydroxybutyrate depolymerase